MHHRTVYLVSQCTQFIRLPIFLMAKYILENLGRGETMLVDTLGQGIEKYLLFEETKRKLRNFGVDGEYVFLEYPASQKPEQFKRLYVRRVA